MRRAMYIALTLLVFALLAPAGSWAQGKGKGSDKKADHGQQAVQKQQKGSNKGQEQKVTAPRKEQKQHVTSAKKVDYDHAQSGRERANVGKPGRERATVVKADRAVKRADLKREIRGKEVRSSVRHFVSSRHATERVAGAALARAYARGIDDDAFVISPIGDRVRVTNRAGLVLLDMDDRRARNLGYWDVFPIGDDVRSGAPSFCRSGAGHPKWGRQWCINKGFGLGRYHDVRWGRATTISDIIFGRRLTTGNLATDVLLGVIGALAFDRLAVHAVTLGYTEPMTGVWVAEPTGPRVLQLYSGPYPVAEFVDNDLDDRADVMFVAYL